MTDIYVLGTLCESHNCPTCGVVYICPKTMIEGQRTTGSGSHYCPNGHKLSYNESENDRLRRERDRLVQRQARLEEAVASRDRELQAERKRAEKLAKRASAGTCPCCTRTFANMGRHMKMKHPDYNVVLLKAVKS